LSAKRRAIVIDEIREIVLTSVRTTAAEQDVALPTELADDMVLFGDGGLLDSLALVSLVIAVEQGLEDRFGLSVPLADEKALSQRRSPYRTLASLIEYAAQELRGRKA
jgi:acyl carrier protein